MHTLYDMGVHVEGGADLLVTQSFLHNLWMNPLDQHNGCVGMPEIREGCDNCDPWFYKLTTNGGYPC